MSTSKITVRPIVLSDRAAWNRLWKGYVTFYKADVAHNVTECLWSRLHDQTSPVRGVVAISHNHIVGIAHYVLSPNTWGRHHICYLEDLFVSPAARKKGTGRALIGWLHAEAKKQAWSRVYWMTGSDNKTAQRLYDGIAQRTGWIRYDLDLSKSMKKKSK